MKTKILSAIVTCCYLSLVGGFDQNGTHVSGTSDPTRRILGGGVTNPQSHKYIVRLRLDGEKLCTGTVVSPYFIVTAAQCLHKQTCKDLEIFPSTWKFGDLTRKYAERCWIHEKFTGLAPLYYDISVIKSMDELFKDNNNPSDFVALPLYPISGRQFTPGTGAYVIGWGETGSGIVSHQLRWATTRVESWDICNYSFKNRDGLCTDMPDCPGGDIPKRVFCTRRQGPDRAGVCPGDIGGPVVIEGALAGIISSVSLRNKRRCSDKGFPIHVNVPDYLPWIYHTIDPERDTRDMKITKENESPIEYAPTHDPREIL